MSKTYFEAFSATIPQTEIASKGGLSYLSAAAAMSRAGRPEVQFTDFGGQPFLACLNGALVAVDVKVPETDAFQRIWLPVMDRDNNTLALSATQATDINNSRQRCLVKALACVYGVGMSLYMGCDGDGTKASKMLGVTPETDLAAVEPVVANLQEGGAAYIEWGVAIAAARITDPTFHWDVLMYANNDGLVLPYREVLGGLMVDVETVYCGKRQRLSLPVMDGAFNPVPAAKATVFDWNKAVMRALTKCLAFNSGYGLDVYASDEFSIKDGKAAAKGRKSAKADRDPAPQAEAASKVAVNAEPPKAAEQQPEPAAQAPEASDAAQAAPEAAPAPVAEAPAQAPAPAAAAPDSDAAVRFKEVMRKRFDEKGINGLTELFDALKVSTKFDAKDKPMCFGILTSGIASLMKDGTDADLNALAVKMREHNAMSFLATDNRELVAAKLVRIFLGAGVAGTDDVLAAMPEVLVSAGIAASQEDVLRLAELGNTPAETIDLVKELTALA